MEMINGRIGSTRCTFAHSTAARADWPATDREIGRLSASCRPPIGLNKIAITTSASFTLTLRRGSSAGEGPIGFQKACEKRGVSLIRAKCVTARLSLSHGRQCHCGEAGLQRPRPCQARLGWRSACSRYLSSPRRRGHCSLGISAKLGPRGDWASALSRFTIQESCAK